MDTLVILVLFCCIWLLFHYNKTKLLNVSVLCCFDLNCIAKSMSPYAPGRASSLSHHQIARYFLDDAFFSVRYYFIYLLLLFPFFLTCCILCAHFIQLRYEKNNNNNNKINERSNERTMERWRFAFKWDCQIFCTYFVWQPANVIRSRECRLFHPIQPLYSLIKLLPLRPVNCASVADCPAS